MIIAGIDPGYERFGIAILKKGTGHDKDEVIFSDCIRTSAKLPFQDRLFEIGTELESIIQKYKPDALAIEKLFFTTNQKTALSVSEIKGMTTYIAKRNKLPVFEYTPLEIKSAVVGYGKATKDQIQKMLMLLVKGNKKWEEKEAIDDEYDACAVALTCSVLNKNFK